MHYNPCRNVVNRRICGRATPYHYDYCDVCRDRASRGIKSIREIRPGDIVFEPDNRNGAKVMFVFLFCLLILAAVLLAGGG